MGQTTEQLEQINLVLKNNLKFLQRTNLTGNEVNSFNQVVIYLSKLIEINESQIKQSQEK